MFEYELLLRLTFAFCFPFSFFFFSSSRFSAFRDKFYYLCTIYHCLCSVYTLFMHCSWDSQLLYSKKILKMGLIVLFTRLKIILLRCFQFSVSIKISCIQTDPSKKKPKKKFITLHPIFNLSLFLMLCFFIFFLTFSLSIIVFKKYWVIWYGCLSNIFQFLNNIIRIFIYFFIHTYF